MKNERKQPNKKELRNFGLITGSSMAGFFGVLLPVIFDRSFPLWPWIPAGILVVLAVLLPVALKPVYRIWMAVGNALGWVNTRIILAIMFYVIFFPTGLVMKLAGKDLMSKKMNRQQDSYRIISVVRDKSHVRRPF